MFAYMFGGTHVHMFKWRPEVVLGCCSPGATHLGCSDWRSWRSSCLCVLTVGVTGMQHHARLSQSLFLTMVLKIKLRSSCLYGEHFAISPSCPHLSQLKRSGVSPPAGGNIWWQCLTFSYKAVLQVHRSFSPLGLEFSIPPVSLS